jgi:hypothetical protein
MKKALSGRQAPRGLTVTVHQVKIAGFAFEHELLDGSWPVALSAQATQTPLASHSMRVTPSPPSSRLFRSMNMLTCIDPLTLFPPSFAFCSKSCTVCVAGMKLRSDRIGTLSNNSSGRAWVGGICVMMMMRRKVRVRMGMGMMMGMTGSKLRGSGVGTVVHASGRRKDA